VQSGVLSDLLLFLGSDSSTEGNRGHSTLGCASEEHKDLASSRSVDYIYLKSSLFVLLFGPFLNRLAHVMSSLMWEGSLLPKRLFKFIAKFPLNSLHQATKMR
jgi:hypothetical protein